MDSLSIISLLQHLLPGFVTAWIFYGLTLHIKPSQFERIVQALIFSFIIQVLLPLWESLCLFIGGVFIIGEWTDSSEIASSLIIALLLGLFVAYLNNKDTLHRLARSLGISEKSSYPSEWSSTFTNKKAYVYLRMEDGESIYGWPSEWPTESNKGHFRIEFPSWITIKGKEKSLDSIDTILIKASDVKSVLFVKEPTDKKPLNEDSK